MAFEKNSGQRQQHSFNFTNQCHDFLKRTPDIHEQQTLEQQFNSVPTSSLPITPTRAATRYSLQDWPDINHTCPACDTGATETNNGR